MPSNQPLRRQFALLITFVLTLSVALLSWAGYRQLEQELAAAARVRLEDVAGQLARMVADAPMRALEDAGILARRPEVFRAATAPRQEADSLLESLFALARERQPQSLGLTLLSPADEVIASVGARPPGNWVATRDVVGPLAVSSEGPAYSVKVPVVDPGGGPVGSLVYVRRMMAEPTVSQRLAALIGSDAHLLIGNRGTDEWMDLNTFEVVPPPRQPIGEMSQVKSPDGKQVLSYLVPAGNTPWSVGVYFPRASALAPARAYVRNIVFVAVIVVLLGAFAASILVRDLTRTIEAASSAAEGIAAGDYSRRIPVTSGDELGRLARSFNTMAIQVESSRHELEEQSAALRELNEDLARNELRYRRFVDASPDAMIVHRGSRVLFANPAAATLLQASSPGELIGRSFDNLADPTRVAPDFSARVSGDHEALRLPVSERELHRIDGSTVTVDAASTPFTIDGKPATLTILRDVTERKQLEVRVRQAQKMEVIGQLASGVAHDFNNLLTVISSYGSLLLADLPHDDARRADVEEILNASRRAAGLTRQLLTLGRQQVLQTRVLDLQEVLTGLESMMRRVLPASVTIRVLSGTPNATVSADPTQIEQVFMNLAVNAVDAMPDGGTLTIETARVSISASELPLYGVAVPGEYVSVAVRDTGQGIAPQDMDKIFEPFFTTKSPGKGTGLGLPTVAEIIRELHGHIAVYSDVGRGTVFRVYLPAEHPLEEVAVVHHETPAPPAVDATVLLVEDEAPVRAVVRRILERAGYRVHETMSGGEALGVAARLRHELDVVVTDMTMPDIDGRVLAGRIAREHSDAVFVFMSGYTESATFWEEVPQNRSVFLQKPFPEDALTRAVADALERR